MCIRDRLLAGRYEVLLPLLFKFLLLLLLLLLLLFQKNHHETFKVGTVQALQSVWYKSPTGPVSRRASYDYYPKHTQNTVTITLNIYRILGLLPYAYTEN